MKSSSTQQSLSSRMANIPASVHTLRRSAPLNSSQILARASKSTSPLVVMDFEWIFRISWRAASLGRGIQTFLSSLPGRSRAGSRMSGLLVAITTFTRPSSSKPSSWFSSSMSVLCTSRSAEFPSLNLLPPMASISSMKMMQGSLSLAYPNISLITLADSPMYLSTMAEATTFRNLASMLEASALAMRVFPVPGGPYMRQPFGGLMPTRLKSSGLVRGSSMVSLSTLSWSPSPPMSEKSTLPGSSLIMLKTMGSTSLGSTLMMVRVVWSSATLAPTTNFDLSIFTFTPTTFRVPLEAFMISVSASAYISQYSALSTPRRSSDRLTEEI